MFLISLLPLLNYLRKNLFLNSNFSFLPKDYFKLTVNNKNKKNNFYLCPVLILTCDA